MKKWKFEKASDVKELNAERINLLALARRLMFKPVPLGYNFLSSGYKTRNV